MAAEEDDLTTPQSEYWEHCPHYDLGPPDMHGVQICHGCGSAVQQRIAGVPIEEHYSRQTTVIAEEGADVAFNWPGEG